MLTSLLPRLLCRRMPRLLAVPLLALSLLLLPRPAAAQDERPADLVIVDEKLTHQGPHATGVFGLRSDPVVKNLWSVRIWEQLPDRVMISTERVRCDTASPMRITSRKTRLAGRQVVMRQLNPGGTITSGNRLDHRIWWAVCHPQFAGRDPAGLAAEARRLGFSGQLLEQELLMPDAAVPPR
ncbi:MAG: hypothetical protein VKI83_12250 [Synechococcaceae cyanobacterium]|nr:hypothetical protein [Synechococcaceae cyanobacterium]